MNNWNIPKLMEDAILERDQACVYCGILFRAAASKKEMPSWEHIINDARIVTLENIARCCIGCNASKGAKDLKVWLGSPYCERKGITSETVAPVVKKALSSQS